MVVKTIDEAEANLKAAIAYIPERYRTGVMKADWKTKAGSEQAEKNYATGVSKAVTEKRRQKGIGKISNEEWQTKASEKGGAVIGARMDEAIPKWKAEFGKVYSGVLSDVAALPPRTTDYTVNIAKRLTPTVKSWKKHSGKL